MVEACLYTFIYVTYIIRFHSFNLLRVLKKPEKVYEDCGDAWYV